MHTVLFRPRKPVPAILRDSSGFSLVELMIGLFLVALSGLAIAQLMELSTKTSRTAEMSAHALEFTNLARLLLTKPSSCTANLAGLFLDTAGLTETPVELFQTVHDPSNPLGLRKGAPLAPGGRFEKIQIEGVSVQPFSQLSDRLWLVTIAIQTRKTGASLGSKTQSSRLVTQVELQPSTSRVANCVAMEETDDIVAFQDSDDRFNEKVCEIASNGAQVYDPGTKKCVLNQNCFEGTPELASCPADSFITNCNAVGLVDLNTDPLKTRVFRSGKNVPGGPPAYLCAIDTAANAARCEYAVDTDLTNTKCRACCKFITRSYAGP